MAGKSRELMVNTFNNFKVGVKILIGYVIALMLMATVIIIALLRIQQINATVINLAEGLAAEQHLADQVVSNVWAAHFYALQYMDQQNPADLERYQAEYANFDQLLAIADQRITKPERRTYLDNINRGIQTYGRDFSEVIDLLTTRNRDLLVNLDQQGRLAEIKLEQIRANSFFADDTVTSYQAGNAQRALLLMRVAAFQYLESGDPYWIDEFNRAYESAHTSFQKFNGANQSQLYRELTVDAQSAVDTYALSFSEIQENYTQQQKIIATRLNVVGPAIREAGAAISSDVVADFQAATASTQALAAQTQWLLLVTMGVALVAALGFGLIIARSITGPLKKVTEVARQVADLDLPKLTSEMDAIAQGDLARHLTITTRALSIRSGDEIGQMARAFNAVIRQLQQAGTAFSDMAAKLRILTERNNRLFEQTQTARQKAEAASQAKSNFLTSMSHELRTPLNAILGYAQILKQDQNLSLYQVEGVAVIEESGEHLLTLLTDILDLAKIEADKLSLQPTVVHLPVFLESVVGMMQLRAREKGLKLDYAWDDRLPEAVKVDEKRLRQVLINLLGNAIKFTSGGTVTLRANVISPSTETDRPQPEVFSEKQIRFIVSDTGIGIRPDDIALIFQPFEQLAAESLTIEGTGLGLPISQRLIRAMGGDIKVKSELGQGSTFWFDLRLPALTHEQPRQLTPSRRITGYAGPRQTILIADDQSHNRSMLVRFLEPLGFKTITARDDQDAVSQAVKGQPDLIILDVVMPGQSGVEISQTIRQHPDLQTIPLIGTSASLDKQPATEPTFNEFLVKPIDFNILLALLGQHLPITWLFAEETTHLPDTNLADYETASVDVIPPPAHELNKLYDLAMKGNMPGVYRRAVEIEQKNSQYSLFTRQLQRFAKAFDEENVLMMVSSYL